MVAKRRIPTKAGAIMVFEKSFTLGGNMTTLCFMPDVKTDSLPDTFFPRLAHLFNKAYEAGLAEGRRQEEGHAKGYTSLTKANGQTKERLYKVASLTGGEIVDSLRGVPHLVIDGYWSVCWFWKTRVYRVWQGYATADNMKVGDYTDPADVAAAVDKLREAAAIRASAGMERPADAREVGNHDVRW